MKAAINTGILCLAVSCSAMANTMETDTCYLMDDNTYQKFMEKANDIKVKNPFKPDQCVLMNYGKKHQSDVDVSHFNGNEKIHGLYEKFQRNRHTRVEMVFDNESGTLYSFMQFDPSEPSISGFKDRNRDATLELFFDEFIFLHELMHLEPKVTRNQLYSMPEREVYADIASVIMLGAKHDMDVSQLHSLLETVKDLRMTDERKLQNRKKTHRSRNGISQHGHYHQESFNNALAYLEHLQTNGISLRVTSVQEASALATYMMRNADRSDSLIDFENKIASIQNDPNRNMFYDLPHSQQLSVYDYFKGEIVARLENWFEAPDEMLPLEQEKLAAVSPMVIEDAMRYFPDTSVINAKTYLDSQFMASPDVITASINIEEDISNDVERTQMRP